MKKEYVTCGDHRELKFNSEDELIEHVKEVHDDDIDDFLKDYRDDAANSVAFFLKESVSVDADEVGTDEESAIDFDKVKREISAGRQRILGTSGGMIK